MMVGRDVKDLYPKSFRQAGEVVLEISGLSGAKLPIGANLELRRGEVLGIAGLVGAGRTELVRSIFGLDAVVAGRVKVLGNVSATGPAGRWAEGVGMVSEDRKREGLALSLNLADNITLPKLGGLGPWRFVLPSRQCAAAQPWIERLPIKCASATQRVNALSGGNQQKVALARLLHADCDVLLLDEPTRGVDVGSKAQIYELVNELTAGEQSRGRQAKAVLMVSSYLPELLGVCDRIAVMSRGRLSSPRDVSAWDEHQLMQAATGQG